MHFALQACEFVLYLLFCQRPLSIWFYLCFECKAKYSINNRWMCKRWCLGIDGYSVGIAAGLMIARWRSRHKMRYLIPLYMTLGFMYAQVLMDINNICVRLERCQWIEECDYSTILWSWGFIFSYTKFHDRFKKITGVSESNLQIYII